MERTVDIATGESVAFSYELAGLGSRFIAVAIDVSIQLLVTVVAFALLLWFAATHAGGGAERVVVASPAVKFVVAVLEGLAIFAGFLLFFGYFIFFEWRFEGRTPGKRLVGIRVVRDGGFSLDFTSAVVRNVVRILEFSLGFYLVSAVATLLSPMNRRLGDMAAGTLVVRVSRYERTVTLADITAEPSPSDIALVRDLSDAERELVRRYVDRRAALPKAARLALAHRIAENIRPKLGASFTQLDDDDLLVHVARGM